MQIEVTYALGTTVYLLEKRAKVVPVTCAACASTGMVALLDGSQYPCPKCQGRARSDGYEQYVTSGPVRRVVAAKCLNTCKERYMVELVGKMVEADLSKLYATEQLATAALAAISV